MSTTVKAAANLITKLTLICPSTSLRLASTSSRAQPTDTNSQTSLGHFAHCPSGTSPGATGGTDAGFKAEAGPNTPGRGGTEWSKAAPGTLPWDFAQEEMPFSVG